MTASTIQKKISWRTILGLIMIYLSMLLNWQWLWGVLFLLWLIPDIKSGVTYFMEPVHKKDTPVLYWIIIISWALMSLYCMAYLVFPSWSNY